MFYKLQFSEAVRRRSHKLWRVNLTDGPDQQQIRANSESEVELRPGVNIPQNIYDVHTDPPVQFLRESTAVWHKNIFKNIFSSSS